MAAEMFYLPFPTAFTSNGLPAAGAKLYFYYSGTSTPAPSYTNVGLSIEHPHPVVANGAGRYPNIYLDDAIGDLRLVIKDRAGVTLQDTDPYIPGEINPGDISFDSVVGLATVGNRILLAALPSSAGAAVLTEAGHEGVFVWSPTNLSTAVTGDPSKLFYVPPTGAPSGASGAWVRRGYSTAPTRAILSTIPTTQTSVYLSETGREGRFIWSSADHEVDVTADPYEALYVPPAGLDGSTGAWRREVILPGLPGALEFYFTWWGVTTATADIGPALQVALNNIPDGSTLIPPPFDMELTTSVVVSRSNIAMRGHGYLSHIHAASAIEMIQFLSGSHISVRGIRFSGNIQSAASNPSCIMIGNVNPAVEPAANEDFEISGCYFDNTSLGIVCTAANDEDTIARITDIRIFNNIIKSDVQGISLFGVERVLVDRNIFIAPDHAANNFAAPIRVVGSKDVMISNNIARGNSGHAVFGGYMVRSTGVADLVLPSENVSIIDNQFFDCELVAIYFLTGVLGDFIVQGNTFVQDPSNTRTDYPIQLDNQVLLTLDPSTWGRCTIKDNKFVGYYGGVWSEANSMTQMTIEGNTFICNSSNSTSDPLGRLFKSTTGAAHLLDIMDNKFLQKPGGPCDSDNQACIINVSDGMIIRAMGNHLPEGCTIAVGAGGTGTLEQSGNFTYPTGSWAAASA